MTDNVIFAVVVLAVTVGIAVVVEMIVPLKHISLRSRAIGGLFMGITTSSVTIFAYGLEKLWVFIGIPPLFPPIEQWAGWAALPITLVVADLLKYWEHRFEHRFFWRVHSIHHSVRDLHAMSNYGHPLQMIPYFTIVILPLSLLNFESIAVPLLAVLIVQVLHAISHSPVDFHFGPFRRLLVDAPYHRIHHSLEERHFDRNFGGLVTIWDQLFGTAYFPAKNEWPDTGVDGVEPVKGFGDYLSRPFIRQTN